MSEPVADTHKQLEPRLANRLKLYVTLMMCQILWWSILVFLGPWFFHPPSFRYLMEFCFIYVFCLPALFFAVVFTIQYTQRLFKTLDVVIVLILLALLTTLNTFIVAGMLPRC